jgi:nucleotide-binding universal stress UspA family protein
MKILIAIDGSPCSLAALEALLARRGWFAGTPELALVHVHLPIPIKRAVAWAGKEVVASYYEEEATANLAPARERLAREGLAFATFKRIGEPAVEIAGLAKEWGADLIVMGTHGHGNVATMLLGSVAQKALALSPVPVLLLR